MCSIEYTESQVGNGLVAFDLNALPHAGNTITGHVLHFELTFIPIHSEFYIHGNLWLD